MKLKLTASLLSLIFFSSVPVLKTFPFVTRGTWFKLTEGGRSGPSRRSARCLAATDTNTGSGVAALPRRSAAEETALEAASSTKSVSQTAQVCLAIILSLQVQCYKIYIDG